MVSVNKVVDFSVQNNVGIITLNSPPVNALSAVVRDGLFQGFTQAIANDQVQAIVLICEGSTFIAGADLTEFGGVRTGTPLPEVMKLIEFSPKPVVAAVHGTALGGGFEVTLCCNYRVAVPSAKVGLTEVTVGVLPGAGGTQRLPRIVGIETALDMIGFGKRISAQEALELEILDALIPEGQLKQGAIEFAQNLVKQAKPLRRLRDENAKLQEAKQNPELFNAFRTQHARKFRGREAPEKAIRAIEASVNLSFDEAMKVERQLFEELVNSDQAKALRHSFFSERQAQRIADVPPDAPVRKIDSVGVIGAGTMGGGIAMNFANVGLPVTLVETNQAALDRGLAIIRKNYENTAKRGGITSEQVEQRVSLITGALDILALADCDLVIEAVFEDIQVKKNIFAQLDSVCKADAILASNTSYLDVNEIAAATSRPESVIGMHFFSPANVMKLLEVVRGDKTAIDVLATVMKLAKKIGKAAVVVGVCYGFVGNRILALRQREANKLILEGALPWQVDRVLYDFGFPMGPFQMHDLSGLDLRWKAETSSSSTINEVLCEMDRRGQKNGKGYYDYDENRKPVPSPTTEKIIQDFRTQKGIEARQISDQEILERCLYTMINEGMLILEEGIASKASDIDVIWVNGYGWPAHLGGPMYYAEQIGLEKVLSRLKHYQETFGDDFKPAALLEKLVSEKAKVA